MEKKTQISSLLDKFRKDKISPEELSYLYTSIKNGSTELSEMIDSDWERISPVQSEADSEALLNAIHSKGKFSSSSKRIGEGRHRSNKVRLLQFARYAAIFILAFGVAWFLRSPQKGSEVLQTTNVAVAYGSKSTIELPDGTIVVLNSGSKLTYPTSFGKDSRTVILSGEGFFEVRKNSKWPFFVKTRGMTIKVTGTKFNVKAYPDENLTETTLVSGSVEIFEEKKSQPPKLLAVLKPNQKAVFGLETVMAEKPLQEVTNSKQLQAGGHNVFAVEENVKTEDLTSWKNNVLIINNEELSELTKKLERWYNVEIALNDNSLASVRFSGKFDKETIQEVLDALSLVQPFKYEINKNMVKIF